MADLEPPPHLAEDDETASLQSMGDEVADQAMQAAVHKVKATSAEPEPNTRGVKKHLTLQQKAQIIRLRDEDPKMSSRTLAQKAQALLHRQVSHVTVAKLCKEPKRSQILEAASTRGT